MTLLPKLLVIGGTGLLGRSWAAHGFKDYQVAITVNNLPSDLLDVEIVRFDLTNKGDLVELFNKIKPALVINCAGKTNVEACEVDEAAAFIQNVVIARELAIACAEFNASFVHISTDHLFHGRRAYATESEPVCPLNAYARSKAAAEVAVSEVNADALIIRTNFYGQGSAYRQSFSDFILMMLRDGKRLHLFEDVFFTPIHLNQLIVAVHQLVQKKASGIFNVCGAERISKYDFGVRLANAFGLDSSGITKSKIGLRSDLNTRPADMSLCNKKVSIELGYEIGSLEKGFELLKRAHTPLQTDQGKLR